MGAEIGAAIGSAVAGGLTGLAQLGINLYRAQQQDLFNQRDFDYQAALQREIFEREDNAVQRRMSDLQAAGLNPNLAAGSAASAGAVVGRSSTSVKDINVGNPVGTALDVASHVMQLRNLREQNQILKNEQRKQFYNLYNNELDAQVNAAETYRMLGFDPIIMYKDGIPKVHLDMSDKNPRYLSDTPLGQILKFQLQNNKNSADLLQKDLDFYTADKIAEYFGAGVSAFSGFGSGLNSFGRYNKFYRK